MGTTVWSSSTTCASRVTASQRSPLHDKATARTTVLFDVGPYGDVWLANAERLALDLSSIDVLFLSHWHWDHSGGITSVVAAIAEARDARASLHSSSTFTPIDPTNAGS